MKYLKHTLVIIFSFCYIIHGQVYQTQKYSSASEALSRGDTVYAISLLKESITKNKDAASNYELAKILSLKKKHFGLTDALQYSRKAVELDEKNIQYRLLMARIREDLFYASFLNVEERVAAKMEYEKIIELDSACAEAYYNLGRLNQEDFNKLNGQVEIDLSNYSQGGPTQSADVINELGRARELFFQKFDTTTKLSMAEENESIFNNAESNFSRAISLQPNNFENHVLFSKLCIENNRPDKILNPLIHYLQINNKNKEAHLFLGLAYYLLRENEKANREYQYSMMLFSEKELKELKTGTTRILLEPLIKDQFIQMDDEAIDGAIYKYWSMNDPLLLTSYNESFLEHISRITYANLLFDVPKLNLVGWKTERGEALIRYGIPEQRIKTRPSVPSGNKSYPSVETWVYPDKILQFVDKYMNKNFTLLSPQQNDSYFFPTQSFDAFNNLKSIRPREYQPSFEGPSFNLPLNYFQFKSATNGFTDSYIVYGINSADTLTKPDLFSSGFDLGIFLLDNRLTTRFKKKELIAGINNFARINFLGNNEILISSYLLTAAPITGSLAFEMVRKKDKGVFTNHGRIDLKDFGTSDFTLSDIVLCADLRTGEKVSSYINRGDIAFLPNPVSTFSHKTSLFIFYEIYNLHLNERNLTNFTQQITIRKKEEGGISNILNEIGDVIGIGKKGEKISLTSDYETPEKDPQMYLQLDMSKYDPGNYVITVTIKDKISGKSVSADAEIIWE